MNAILVLDDISKEKIKSNVSSLISRGIAIVNSLSEITTQMLQDTTTTFIMEGTLQKNDGLAELRFYKAALNLDYIFLMTKSKWDMVIHELGRIFQTNIVNLNFDTLQAAMYGDKSLETPGIQTSNDAIELAKKICAEDSDYKSSERILADALLSTLVLEQQIKNKLDTMKLRCEQLECENSVLRTRYNAYLSEYTKIFEKAVQLNSALSQYEVIFTKDLYQKIDLYSHNERPAIIYIKEHEWLAGFDKLIETLFNAIRIQNKQSVKVLRLFDSSSSRRLLTLPKYYHVIKNKYKMSDVESSDFVCKTGDYMRILDSLLLNRMHLDVLIIVDCKDHNDTVLSGSHIIFNVCGRTESLESLHLSSKNTITNDENSDLYWDDYDTRSLSKNEAFVYLSSRPVIGVILQSVNAFEGYTA